MKESTQTTIAILTAFIAGAGLVVAIAIWQESKRDNMLDELATVIQMNEEQQKQYLANRLIVDK